MADRDPNPDPAELLPPPAVLRERLSRALRDVDVLRGLLRLSEGVARRDGRAAGTTPVTRDARREVPRG